jgi:hypothetical protein
LSSKLAEARNALSCHPPEERLHHHRDRCKFDAKEQSVASPDECPNHAKATLLGDACVRTESTPSARI